MPDYKERARWNAGNSSVVYMLLQKWRSIIGLDPKRWDRADFIEDGIELIAPRIAKPYAKSSRTLADQFEIDLPSRFKTDRWSQAYARQFTRELATNVAADLRGLGKQATAEDVLMIFSRNRAIRAGETSVTTAISAGELDAAEVVEKIKGRKLQVVWHIDPLSNVCKPCLALDGSTKDVWIRKFPMGPPAHPRCACYLEFS